MARPAGLHVAHLEAADGDGLTPVMHAAAGGHLRVLKELYAAGARMEARNLRGETALWLAAANGHLEVSTKV